MAVRKSAKLQRRKGTTRNDNKYLLLAKTKDKDDKRTIKWSAYEDNDQYIFSLDDLITIVTLDLDNGYQSRGPYVQAKTWMPYRGILSPIYANVKCAHDKYLFFQKYNHTFKHRVCGIRQMDDLIL